MSVFVRERIGWLYNALLRRTVCGHGCGGGEMELCALEVWFNKWREETCKVHFMIWSPHIKPSANSQKV